MGGNNRVITGADVCCLGQRQAVSTHGRRPDTSTSVEVRPDDLARGWFDGGMEFGYVVAIIIAVVGFSLVLAGNRSQSRGVDKARLAAIERKLDVIMNHLEISEPPPEEPDVVAHLEKGELIQAIKVYRERTGLPLAEAKDAVERIARERGLDRR